jgi:hypothetical protein
MSAAASRAHCIRITHRASGTVIAQGPLGWGITPFEGNYYISRRYLKATFKPTFIPGVCVYKFFYTWMDLILPNGGRDRNLGWLYWLPNPLLPFIWYRVAVSASDPTLTIEETSQSRGKRTYRFYSTLAISLSRSRSAVAKDLDRRNQGFETPGHRGR